ncbi:release factor glutamine methyltransferase [Formosa sp. Hel1_31_208]|uniref:peptide chain release factor N(5)-glutamine methyltransferase n=1 Tax=Formosa sp. Hel1_31_208 TaxID=1798225 RepID=UPI00087DEE3C|nr:peptide chain release factor N(5)-glutamine methyltransferase [Formosa sp. Hel1_31_208]SDS54537.1 release factor glutamine methyltransferase [Formosa sp. Hel1_31_208]
MRLKAILHIYHTELDSLYGNNEVDSFFNLVVEHYLGIKRIHLVMDPEYAILKTEEQPIFEALSALKLEQPIQYILGETEFYGLPFKVNSETLIPRPETEELVALILDDVSSITIDTPLKIIDIGTGSGCIAISLAKQLQQAKVSALDVSEAALKVAKRNAEMNTVDIEFICNDILNPRHNTRVFASNSYDIIVSNPPYIRNLEKEEITSNVLDYEPHLALFVEDKNPLQFYKAICEFALLNLKDSGTLYFEINEYLGAEMIALMKNFGFKDVALKTDIFGKDRIIKGIK